MNVRAETFARAAVVDVPSTAHAVIAAVHLDGLGESV
jgi:hypothetical protein